MTRCTRCKKPGTFKVYADGSVSKNCVRCLDYFHRYYHGELALTLKKVAAPPEALKHLRRRVNLSMSILDR